MVSHKIPVRRELSLQLYEYSVQDGQPTLTHYGERQSNTANGHHIRSATELDASAVKWIQRELESRTSATLLHRHNLMGHFFVEVEAVEARNP